MTKLCILGDLHLACRLGSTIFAKHQQKFFHNILFPFLEKTEMSVLQLGDMFDHRKFIGYNGLQETYNEFFDKIPSNTFIISLLGNHDIAYKESLRVNSPSLLLKNYTNITIVDSPTTINGIDVIPWICDENRDAIHEFINQSSSKICCGHFEISGFSMQRGIPAHDGLDIDVFNKYDLVLSGHYHTKSTLNNITYVGTPYELTWADHKDIKGFHILDTDTLALEFIENPYTLYESIQYDDRTEQIIDYSRYAEKYVKVIVINKTDYTTFDQVINKLNSVGAYDVKIIESYVEQVNGVINDDIVLGSTLHVLDDYINSLNVENVNALKTQLKNLYLNAMETT